MILSKIWFIDRRLFMSKVAIITDSNSGISQDEGKKN